jgi:hypothetical protein
MERQLRRRRFVATTAGLGTVLLAGCSGDGTEQAGGTGEFRLLISDQPAAIDDFDRLTVTLSSARVFRADADDEHTSAVVNGTVDGAAGTEDADGDGFVEFDIDNETVDLTEVKGDRAISVLEGELDAGRYSGIELRVASAEGVVDGEQVDVMVPSDRLRIIRPFEIAADEALSFVFDISVIKKGRSGEYNLLPVIGKSGVAGEDVDVEEVETENGEA